MPPRSIEQQPLFRLLQYSKTYRPQIWSAIAFTMLNQLCDLAPPYLIGLAVDSLVERDRSLIARLGITDAIGQLAILSVLTFMIAFGATWHKQFSTNYELMPTAMCKRWRWSILKIRVQAHCSPF
jgi:ABC-type multidrug transport system fused ATPase/permease subunit